MSLDAEYVAVYDISSNHERRRVDKTLKGFGFRIQKSVFECRLRKGDRERLLICLDNLKIRTGFVKIYRLDSQAKQFERGEAVFKSIDKEAAYIT